MSERIVVGMSGGVDSSVAALLLKEQGYDVVGVFMKNWEEEDINGTCTAEEDWRDVRDVCDLIGIPYYSVNFAKEYWDRVFSYFLKEYRAGRTPNPDVLCNREIKFDAFWKAARKLGADMVATGHYCRKEQAVDADGNPLKDADGNPIWSIFAGSDPNKDQSYFLCQLTQEQLATALFPIGDIVKPEVRRLAHEADLPSADKKDSQGICFVGKVDLPTFLQQKLKSVEGDVIEVYDAYYDNDPQYKFIHDTLSSLTADGSEAGMITGYISEDKCTPAGKGTAFDPEKISALTDEELIRLSTPVSYDIKFETETYRSGKHHVKKTRYKDNPYGKVLGKHDGAQFYTIGQRKGLNIGGHKDPVFVIATDTEKNIIYVGEGHTHKGLSRSCLRIVPEDIHWIREDLAMKPGEMRRYRVRIRYRQPLQDATVIMREAGLFILFDTPQRGITPGQFAVWYTQSEEMLGSGII